MNSPKPKITFAMCTFNDASLLSCSIDSLLEQEYENWELLVLDNSTTSDEPWEILSLYAKLDNRIKIFRSKENVGWAKGMSLLLEKASGEYATFLAADDYIEDNALTGLANIMCESKPDIVWVGYRFCMFKENKIYETGRYVPEYRIYEDDPRDSTIVYFMQNIYYNSLFHYMRIDFLKQNNIDFFSPYYSDCGSMTVAMCKAKKMAAYPGIVYNLVLNTSQTAGHYVLGSYKSMFVTQWDAIQEVFNQNHAPYQDYCYAARRIGKNYFEGIRHLCAYRCRNSFMNDLAITTDELAGELKKMLEDPSLQNLHYYMGLDADKLLLSKLQAFEIDEDAIPSNVRKTYIYHTFSWIAPAMYLAAMTKDKSVDINDALPYLLEFLQAEENKSCMGFGLLSEWMEQCADTCIKAHAEQIESVIDKYDEYTKALR